MRSEAYLSEIRKAEGLKRAVLKKITVEGRIITFFLLTDLTYSADDLAYAVEVSKKYIPEGCEGKVKLTKSVPDAEAVKNAILEILSKKSPAAAAFLSPQDVEVETVEGGGKFFLSVGEQELSQFAAKDLLDFLSAELMRRFCGTWIGVSRRIERDGQKIEHDEPPSEEYLPAPRTFPISDYAAIDGAAPNYAVCIADLSKEQQNITLCGRIVRMEEKLTKKEKPFFRIAIEDDTSQIAVSYFSKKATIEKVRKLKAGDSVCLTGNYEMYNGYFSFTAKSLDLGAPPKDYTPAIRPSRPAPDRYKVVFPEPISDLVQADMFGQKRLPPEFYAQKFVVFDLETTGLTCTADHIIEIGAVKIDQGEICQKFSTFISCPVRLSPKIIELTGISDEMLSGAPEIKDVVADFFKFTQGSVLVAHNAPFDCGFIRHFGEKEGFLFDNKVMDTLVLAQKQMILSNYKLNTIADQFGFRFNHHRAFDDAFVTAKIFLELMKR